MSDIVSLLEDNTGIDLKNTNPQFYVPGANEVNFAAARQLCQQGTVDSRNLTLDVSGDQ